MKLLKIFSLVFALTFCAIKAFCVEKPIIWKFTTNTPKHIENNRILNENIVKFEARGGEYVIINTTTGEYIDYSSLLMKQYEPRKKLVFGNILRLFNYAAGLHSGIIKENDIAFYTENNKIFDKIDKKTKDDLFQSLGLKEKNTAAEILHAYVKLLKNEDNYLTEAQLAVLKRVLYDNVATGKAKSANVEGCNVSGIGSTQHKNKNPNMVLTTFIGEFEANGQNYAIMTILDEPMPKKSTYGFNSAGWNTERLARDIITNMAQTMAVNSKDLLQKKLKKFSAIGGAYMIVEAETNKPMEEAFINFDKNIVFRTSDFSNLYSTVVGLNTDNLKEEDINFADKPLNLGGGFSSEDKLRILEKIELPLKYDFKFSIADQLQAYLNIVKNKKGLLTDSQLKALEKKLYQGTVIGNMQNIEYYGLISNTRGVSYANDLVLNTTNRGCALFIGNFSANDKEYGLAIAIELDIPQGLKDEPTSKWERAYIVPMINEIIRNFIKD